MSFPQIAERELHEQTKTTLYALVLLATIAIIIAALLSVL